MSNTQLIEKKQIDDYISDISQRLDRLETGGKPITGVSGLATGTFTLAAGEDIDLGAQLEWSNPDITAQPHGVPYLGVYVDTNNDDDFIWPYGSSLSSGQKNVTIIEFMNLFHLKDNPNKSRVLWYFKNNDSSSHTYYIEAQWTYSTGSSGSS